VIASLSLFVPINLLTILSSLAIAGGLYFVFVGVQLLERKGRSLAIPSSTIRNAASGLVEVNGAAAGPHMIPAPITGKLCFLYHTVAWQQREGHKQQWEKVAEEILHLPFFVDDATGQLLVEPLGADLDVHCDFREEYGGTFFSSNLNEVPARIMVFLSRHGIVPVRRIRIEETLIKSQDALFIVGTVTENPGIQVRRLTPRNNDMRDSSSGNSSKACPARQIIRLQSGTSPSGARDMSQQAKIAAALTRAGVNRPEAWFAAGVPYKSVALEEGAEDQEIEPLSSCPSCEEASSHDAGPKTDGFNLTPPVVLMKGANDPTFVISFRSQKEFVSALAWKSGAMMWGGAAITLLGIYSLLAEMGLL
jgi:hypothetical protein